MPGVAVAFRPHAEVILERFRVGLEKLVELFCGPDVERALLLDDTVARRKRVCILGTVETALGAPEVLRDVRYNVLRHQLEGRFVWGSGGKELVELQSCR